MTGGRVLAGFHEVVVVPETIAAIEKAKYAQLISSMPGARCGWVANHIRCCRKENRSTWRISSTLFAHIASGTAPLSLFQLLVDLAWPVACDHVIV